MLCNVLSVDIAEDLVAVRVAHVHQHVGVGVLGELEGRVVEPGVGLGQLQNNTR